MISGKSEGTSLGKLPRNAPLEKARVPSGEIAPSLMADLPKIELVVKGFFTSSVFKIQLAFFILSLALFCGCAGEKET